MTGIIVKRSALVRSELILRDMTLKDLAARAGVTPRMLAYVLRDQRGSGKVRRVVSETLGIGFEDLWGHKDPSQDVHFNKGQGD